MIARFVLVLLIAGWLESNCFAQAVSGSINGYVTDPSESPITSVTVTVTNEQTGIQTKTSTNGSGFYNATNLPPGRYSVRSEQTGFSTVTREHVTLEVDATVRVDLR